MSLVEGESLDSRGIDYSFEERFSNISYSLSTLKLAERDSLFNRDIRKAGFQSDTDIIDYCFLKALGNKVVHDQDESCGLDMVYREQRKTLENFWRADSVENVLDVIKSEDITENKEFYTSLIKHLDSTYKKWNEENIHEEVLSWVIYNNLRRRMYKRVKGLVDTGLPVRHSLEIVINR